MNSPNVEDSEVVDKSIAPDSTAEDRLTEISTLEDVVKVIGLNDLHQGKQETPTSIATATTHTIYPELSSNVINCGMSLIQTDLSREEISSEFVSKFCEELTRCSTKYKPNREDAIQMLLHGAEYVVDQHGCDPEVLEQIENGGSMFTEESRPDNINNVVPPWLLQYSGTYENTPIPSLAGNHFIEFQAIDEISDEGTASDWGLSEEQVVIFTHGDYTLTSMLNWHHANRLKFRERIGFQDRLKMQLSKAAFHLLRGGVRNFRANWSRYDNRDLYTPFDTRTPEGTHLSTVFYAAMNFAYANRLLASLCIEEAISEATSDQSRVELLWDVGHDTIQKETIDDRKYWIHRKGAAKAVPGKPAIVAGSYNMNSYLGKCEPGAEAYLNSYDHGSSHVVKQYRSNTEETLDEETVRYSLADGSVTGSVRHIRQDPIDSIARNLSENNVVSGVAWLRPIASIGT